MPTLTRRRERVLAVLHRYLREYDDIPGRIASKLIAAHMAAELAREPLPERRCRLTLAELREMPAVSPPDAGPAWAA